MTERDGEYSYREVIVPEGWENEGPWQGEDWSEIFGVLSTQELSSLYGQLSFSTGILRIRQDEVDFMKNILGEEGMPTDDVTATQHLLMLKSSHLRWIEGELGRRLNK